MSAKAKAPHAVRELNVRYENGDLATMRLCRDCEGSTGDFLKILGSRKSPGSRCDRCGLTEDDERTENAR